MEFSDADQTFRTQFFQPGYEPESFVQSIVSKSIGSIDLMNMKRRMHLIASQTKIELEQNLYDNHTKFIEAAKKVLSLELEIDQLHFLLADQQQLLNNIIKLWTPVYKTDTESLDIVLDNCENLDLIPTSPDRRLIHSGKLFEVDYEHIFTKQDQINISQKRASSYFTNPCYGFLFNDNFIIVKSTDIHTSITYDIDQICQLDQNLLRINNANDDRYQQQISNLTQYTLRNSFSIKYNNETLTFMCSNIQSKNQWVKMFNDVLHPQQQWDFLVYNDSEEMSSSSLIDHQQAEESFKEEFFSDEWIINIQDNLVSLLVERNFDEVVVLILRAQKYVQEFISNHSQSLMPFVNEYMKDVQSKAQELCRLIEKEIENICERGCSMSLLNYYFHDIQILKQLGYVSKALDLFIAIQQLLMKKTLGQTNLEEFRVVFVEIYVDRFFKRLIDSYNEFNKIFEDQNLTLTKFIVWISSEIERLITTLYNQKYISTRNFISTMKNIKILLDKANEFSSTTIDVKFLFEERLEPILIEIISEQKSTIISTLRRRYKNEKWTPTTLQTTERLQQLYSEFREFELDSEVFFQPYVTIDNSNDLVQIDLASSTLKFAKYYLTFSHELFKIHYQLINETVVKALYELIKHHLKHYEQTLLKLKSTDDQELKMFIMKNVDFSINHIFHHVHTFYELKLGDAVKYFTKVYERMCKLKELAGGM